MNASKCCRTIGCNCAGTQFAENLASLKWYHYLIVVIVIGIVLFFIQYGLPKLSTTGVEDAK
jgi:hypothetical protein